MAKTDEPQVNLPGKGSRRAILVSLAVASILGGAGFFVTYSGMILSDGPTAHQDDPEVSSLPDIAFVPIDPVIISLGPAATAGHLRMTSQLEVGKSHAADVALLMPRILDVINGYLRAVEVAQLEDPAALVRLRAQLLRRIQTVTGDGRVRDLLITEFVLN